ncbi:hypothetical protein P691DRAFT_803270, partial [Macrolepiota fuliginosa MF-IS2]
MKTALQFCVLFALIFTVLGRPIPVSKSLGHSQESSQASNTCLPDGHGGACGEKNSFVDKPTVVTITGRYADKNPASSGGHSLGAKEAAPLSVTSNTEDSSYHNKRNKTGASKGDNEDEEEDDDDDGGNGDEDEDEDEDEEDEDEDEDGDDEEGETGCDDED